MEYNDSAELLSDDEIIDSKVAQSILPYLTLDKLTIEEQTEILRLASDYIKLVDEDWKSETYGFDFSNKEFASQIAHIISEDEGNLERYAADNSIKNREARKLFFAYLLKSAPEHEAIGPLFTDYIGGEHVDLDLYCGDEFSALELFAIAKDDSSNYGKAVRNWLANGFTWGFGKTSKMDKDSVLEYLTQAQPIAQLHSLSSIWNMIAYKAPTELKENDLLSSLDFEAFLYDTTKRATLICDYIKQSDNSTPLIKIVAEEFEDAISQIRNPYAIQVGPQKFVERLMDIVGVKQKYAHKLTIDDRSDSTLSETERFLLETACSPGVQAIINSQLGIDFTDITLSAQIQLLNFMIKAKDNRYDSLCQTMNIIPKELRINLAEGFLATDFGDDFGDSLLTIASSESLSNEEKERILDSISSCRESISSITSLYQEIDGGEFAKEYTRAANERLTDAIMAFSQIAETGSATADLGWAGNISLNYDDAIKALEYEMKSLEIISGTFSDVTSGVKGAYAERFMSPDESHNRSFYNLFSPNHGYVLLYTRPEGAGEFDPSTEYGKYRNPYSEEDNVGVEASISMIVDPIEPFELPIPYRPTKRVFRMLGEDQNLITRMMNKVSAIRLDREGRAPNSNPNDAGRNPTNPIGTISVDLAAILDGEDMPSGKIARLFSVGNKIRAEKRGESEFSLNHNTNWFNQDRYGTSDGFSKLVDYLDSQMAMLCAIHPPKLKEGFAGSKKRSRGRIAAKAA